MRKSFAALAALVVALLPVGMGAQANPVPPPIPAPVQTGPGTVHYDGPPPDEYVKESLVLVLFTNRVGIDKMCGVAPASLVRLACRIPMKNGGSLVVMPHPHFIKGEIYAGILDHELGHVNGWPGNHPVPTPTSEQAAP